MSDLYIPASAINLKDIKIPRIILGLQGEPGTGKTTGAFTFPNPVLLATEPGWQNFTGTNTPCFPVHDSEWVSAYADKKFIGKVAGFPNRMGAIEHILKFEGLKLKPEQTLIIDSWTGLQQCFDDEMEINPPKSKKGSEDVFAFWDEKIQYSEKVMVLIHSMKCNVVVCFHESRIRDPKTNLPLDKTAPLMQGKFSLQIKRFFPNYFRTIVEEKKDPAKGYVVTSAEYKWQVKSDAKFDAKCTLDVGAEALIEPNFSVFSKYPKKVSK